MGSRSMTEAVMLDALGTLVELEPPWVHLAEALGTDADERLIRAVRAEMTYYKAHSQEGRDAASLADLRRRCADVLSRELGRPVDVETLMASIRFQAFPDSLPALTALRERGLRLVCVSNWDCSLGEVLRRCGLGSAVDAVFTSAATGSRKPDPAIFDPALACVKCPPERALYVGDTPEEDLEAARRAGIPALLIARDGGGDIQSLEELVALLGGRRPGAT